MEQGELPPRPEIIIPQMVNDVKMLRELRERKDKRIAVEEFRHYRLSAWGACYIAVEKSRRAYSSIAFTDNLFWDWELQTRDQVERNTPQN
jgi:hypothetical protein